MKRAWRRGSEPESVPSSQLCPTPCCMLWFPGSGLQSWHRDNLGPTPLDRSQWLQDLGAVPLEGADPQSPHVPPLLCLQLFLFRTVTLRPPHNFTQCTTRGSFPQPWHETLYNMLGFACLFLLPLLIMVCCYTRILLEISRRMGSSLCECPGARLPCPRMVGLCRAPGMERAGGSCAGTPGPPLGVWGSWSPVGTTTR